MTKDNSVLKIAYQLVSEFLDAINRSDIGILESKFNTSKEVYKEIQECLIGYFDEECQEYITGYFNSDNLNLSPPPFDVVIESFNSRSCIFKLSGDGDDNCYGVDCRLWNNMEKSEPIAHFYLYKERENNFRLQYCYTGS
jgi:hypothetical protein